MNHPSPKIIAVSALVLAALAGASPARAEREAKLNSGKVGIKRSEEEWKKELDKHTSTKLKCAVDSGAVGQYMQSPVEGVRGRFVGCHAPTPVCFEAEENLVAGRKSFITSLNTRFGSKLNVDMDLPRVPECAIPSEKLNVTLKVDVKNLATGVKAYVDFKFAAKYINAQKVSFGDNKTYPKLDGTTYPRANGSVITAYTNYDRSFSFKCKVEVDTVANDVDVDLNLDYEAKNIHYCEATHTIADQTEPPKIDCPKP